MAQSIKSSLILSGMGILLGAASLFYYDFFSHAPSSILNSAPHLSTTEYSQNSPLLNVAENQPEENPTPQVEEFERLVLNFIQNIRQQYADSIHNVAVQVQLKEFLDELLKIYPQQGRALFENVIQGAFPDIAKAIVKAVDTMVLYDDWLLDNILDLNDMTPLKYNGALWEKRRELFGNNANKIWSSEITAQEERVEVLQRTVALLDQAHDTTMYERIYILQSSYEEQYSDTIENAVFDSKGVLAQTLFGFDSVQKELSGMSNDARQTEIDTIRRTIGFDEHQILYLAEQDQMKDLRWQNGASYMDARQILRDELSDKELEMALEHLREKHFKHEAPTIAREEANDFFRYTRPRIYGRN